MDLSKITVNGGLNDFWSACICTEMFLLESKGKDGEDRLESIKHYAMIGRLYLKQDMYQEALENLSKALKMQEECACMDSLEIADLYVHIGCSYFKMGDYVHAMEYCTKAKGLLVDVNEEESKSKLSWCRKTIKKCQNKLADQE